MGYHPHADGYYATSTSPLVERRLYHLLQVRQDTQTHMTRVQQLWVKHRDTPKFKIRDQVWLDGRNLKTDQPTSTLALDVMDPFLSHRCCRPSLIDLNSRISGTFILCFTQTC